MVDKETLRQQMLLWDESLSHYSLPAWESFPMLPLYMDQVVFLLNQYLTMLPEEASEKQLTPAMINNYVKLKIIPPPVKKRYGRVHLAYLLIVCICKQTLNTNEIKKLIPLSLSEEEVRLTYESFNSAFAEMQRYVRQEIQKAVKPVFSQENEPVHYLLFRTAAAANLTKLLTEEILRLEGENELLSEKTKP